MHQRVVVWSAATVACLAALCTFVVEASLPRVRLIATGGTIANHVAGRLDADALVRMTPGLRSHAEIETETFASAASLGLTLDDWVRLGQRVAAAFADPRLSAVVVTTGTDTLEELAWFLELTTPDERPVVVTGAMRRPSEPDADGPGNLRDAVAVAVSPEARGRGALVVIHGQAFPARSVRKVHVNVPGAFDAPGDGPLATIADGVVTFAERRAARMPAPFDATRLGQLPRVDILLTYQDAPGDLIASAVSAGARGLVLITAGRGSLTRAQRAAVSDALRRGVTVVASSRMPGVALTEIDEAGVIPSGTLAPVKARVLLMLALSQGLDRGRIAALFARCGS
ncbi:MAG TPA: asparaginase [Vicinamibacterales bacterium]